MYSYVNLAEILNSTPRMALPYKNQERNMQDK